MKAGNTRLCELTPQERYTLQRAAREQMKCRLLADIAVDLTICKLEGWDYTEYVRELHKELSRILHRIHRESVKI